MKKLLLAFLITLSAGAASAASMWVRGDTLFISGQTSNGDYTRLQLTWGDDIKKVILDGPGGSAQDAQQIAEFIQPKGVTTVVEANKQCSSACAMIWLAGKERIAEEGSQIGLHFAYLPAKNMQDIALEFGWNGVRETINKMAIWSYKFYDGMEILDKEALFDKMSYNTELWTLTPAEVTDVIGATYVK